MPFLRPPGSRAPAPAPVNLQEATAGQQPDQPGEILTFGNLSDAPCFFPASGDRRSPRPPGSSSAAWRWQRLLDLHDAASRAPVTARTQRPPPIDVLIASAVSFPLRGTPGALLQVQYLQAGHGPAAIWATLSASGLPRDTSYYTATAGDCVRGHPRMLASASSLPRPAYGHADPAAEQPARLSTDGNLDQGHQRARHRPWRRPRGIPDAGCAGRAVPTPPGLPVCP